MKKTFRQAMAEKVLVFDGACGTNLQFMHLSKEDYAGHEGLNDWLVLSRPDVILRLHESFLEVGCDVVETDTFGSTRLKLDEYGEGARMEEVNQAAVRLARQACDKWEAQTGSPRYVAGSLGPTGKLPSAEDPDLSNITPAELEAIYLEQAACLAQAGVDALIIETSQDMLELRAALFAARRAVAEAGRDIVIITQTTLDPSGRMLLGTDIASCMETLVRLGTDVIGLNCSTGPLEMKDSVRFLTEHCPLPVSCIPNAGMPENLGDGKARYPLTPEALGRALGGFAHELGVDIVGGCCGTTPEHLAQVVKAVAGLKPKRRGAYPALEPAVSSMLKRVPLRQEPAPLMIGERLNAQGSRKFKQMLLAEDWDQMTALGREQAEGGAHVLDLCVANNERADEKAMMCRLVKKLSLAVDAPLVIDSTEADVIEVALAVCPGRAIINSINLEGDGSRLHKVSPLAKKYGSAVVALCIDGPCESQPGDGIERGMAKTRGRKLAVAERMLKLCSERYGLKAEDLLFDALTFTLATGEAEFNTSAIETIEGIKLIKQQIPGCFTTLGLSNVSFGLKPRARQAVNSVFLHHCVKAGLDTCIVNPKDITPYGQMDPAERELAEDLVFYRRPDALARIIAHFDATGSGPAAADAAKPGEGLPCEQRIHFNIVHRIKEGMIAQLDEALKRHAPVDIINKILLPAMKEVGDKFGSGELILPFVLQSAEVMKLAVAHVEQFLDKDDSVTKGTVVLATVYGDVHDIGKNLVRTILANNGYVVHDLGKQVPIATVLAKAEELKADIIGLSALLVSTSKQMPLAAQELHSQGKRWPLVIGGAAINRRYGLKCSFVDQGQAQYAPGVFYARDAFEGLDIINALMDPEQRAALTERTLADAREAAAKPDIASQDGVQGGAPALVPRSATPPAPDLPKPPFWGSRVLEPKDIDLKQVFPCMEHAQLFRLNWGLRFKDDNEYRRQVAEKYGPMLEALQEDCMQRGLLQPRAAYGYWPCAAEGDELVLYTDAGGSRELMRFRFDRQSGGQHLCMSDYAEPKGSARGLDSVGFSVVTMGELAGKEAERLNLAGDFSASLYLHGLAVQAAEGLVEWLNRRARAEWGIAPKRGLRFSPGYPAWVNMEDQRKIWQLLEPGRIGVSLTEGFAMDPEQSTSAIIFHHPACQYFNAASRAS